MQRLKDISNTILSTKQVSKLLILSAPHLSALKKRRAIKQLGQNQWSLAGVVQGYIKSLQESRRYDNSEALRRVREAQLRKIEMANDERARRLIPYEEAQLVLDVVVGFTRAELNVLPMRLTRDLAEQRKLQTEIDKCLNRIADKMVKQGAILRNGERGKSNE